MLIVDENADRELAESLRHFMRAPTEMASVHFYFDPKKADIRGYYSLITQLTQEEIEAEDTTLYFCDDGEILIMAPKLQARQAHKLAYRLAQACDLTTAECGFSLHNLRETAGKLLLHYEEKLAQKERHLNQQRQRLYEKEEAVRVALKRKSILDISTYPATDMRAQRQSSNRDMLEVMVIEDDMFSLRLVEKLLGKEHHVTGLTDVDFALATYIKIAPDILFLDINLPNVSGHELLEKILQIDPHAFVVMLSSHTDRDNVMGAMKLGAQGFVAKPFTPDKLMQYIKRCQPPVH